jgi:hypothetical protein
MKFIRVTAKDDHHVVELVEDTYGRERVRRATTVKTIPLDFVAFMAIWTALSGYRSGRFESLFRSSVGLRSQAERTKDDRRIGPS